MLYGRTAELAAIDEVISRARAGAGAALVLRGEAGVGKTALLEAAGARGDGMPVLRATGVEPESDLAFATLHRLLRPVTGLLDTLPVPQRAAVGGALGLTGAASGDRFLLGAGVLSLLAEAAAPDGLVCVVDDLPWVDRASADALLFAARRLGTERVAMLFGVRGDMPVKGVPSMTVDGLSEPAAAELLDADVATPARPGRDGIGPAVRRELVALTAGNPLALRETVRRLTPGQLAGREPLPDPLPGGTRLFGEQVAALTPTTRTVALLAALESDLDLVLRAAASLPPLHDTNLTSEHLTGEDFTSASLTSEDFTGEHLTGASLQGVGLQGMGLHGTDPQDAAPQDAGLQDAGLRSVGLHGVGAAEAGRVAVDELEAAGLASVTGSSVRFRHPLVRSAVYEAATPAARRRAHAVLAGPADGDRRAWHLAAATLGQDEAAATALAETAARARDRGGYGDAATALARAAELTSDPRARAVRLKDAAVSAWLGGRPGQAESLLADAREQGGRDARLEAEIAQLRGRFELNSGNAAEAVRILMAGDSLTMLADASEAASYAGDVAAIVEVGRRAAAHPEGFLRDVLTGIGLTLSGGTPAAPGDTPAESAAGAGHDLLRRALTHVGELREAAEFMWATAAASYLGEADLSAELAARAGRVSRVSGMVGQLPVVLEFVATGERIAGRLAESQAVSEEGLELAREAGYGNTVAAHLANLAVVAALRGEEETCRRHAQEALAIALPHRVGLRAGVAAYALAMLDLGLGRHAAAHDRFVAIAAAGPGAGHPTVVWRSTPDRIEAAVAAGDMGTAKTALAAYERWSARAATAESRALLARCRALLGTGHEGLEEALRLHANPYEAARTALLLGERLRRAHRPAEARPHLRTALETFRRAGARPWARRADGELRAAGESARPATGPALDVLTPQELRIAGLVADGLSSKEIAAQLFLSPRTVEYHLYKIYPKLGIGTRTELARLVVLRKAGAAGRDRL